MRAKSSQALLWSIPLLNSQEQCPRKREAPARGVGHVVRQDDGRGTPNSIRQIWVRGLRVLKTPTVPEITGHIEVTLTVSDPARSAAWYSQLLGMQTRYDHTAADASMRYVCLVEPLSGLVLCLVGHASADDRPFNEFRVGLDHLEFLVARREDLVEWVAQLDHLGIKHSGVKSPSYTQNSMLTFRDPDNIQLEFFWRAPRVSIS